MRGEGTRRAGEKRGTMAGDLSTRQAESQRLNFMDIKRRERHRKGGWVRGKRKAMEQKGNRH